VGFVEERHIEMLPKLSHKKPNFNDKKRFAFLNRTKYLQSILKRILLVQENILLDKSRFGD